MHVPFIDLNRSVQKIRAAVLADWERCLDQCEFVGGPTVKKLEKALEEKLDAQHFVTCHSGTDAIVLGLQALGVKPGMKVAVTNMTFWAPFEAIVACGATPILIDCNEDDLQMDFDEFVAAHKKFKFEAAIFVHLFGWTSARLGDFRRYCAENKIALVEDGAQSFGVAFEGRSVYADAEVATISFYPAKVLGAGGDAGGVAAKNAKVADLVRVLGNHGRAGHYTYDYVGMNSRMGGLQASYLYRMLEQIDGFLASRLAAERFYQKALAGNDKLMRVYAAPKNTTSNGYLSVITCQHKKADEVVAAMTEKGVSCGRTYPQTLDMQPPAHDALRISDLTRSRRLSESVVNLPLFAGITEEECRYAADTFLKVMKA